jgi:tetratricopeptide (TPR) repeat protein
MNPTDEIKSGSLNVEERAAADFDETRARAARRERVRDLMLALVVVLGLASVFALARRLDARRPAEDPFATYEEMYVRPETARRLSLGFNGLAADWYWLRSLQYVGRKVEAYKGDFTLDDMSPLDMRNLGALLEQATTLDPQFMAAYEFGAVVLPSIDRDAAVRLVEKGIRENPREWRLYQHLGYIHWQAGRFRDASEAYSTGARVEGAPPWMNAMAAQMNVNGGSRQVAREMYRRMYQESTDEQVRTLAARRLAQINSLEEREVIRRALADFSARAARCPSSWREVAPVLRAARLRVDANGSPLDPSDVPYLLDTNACDVKLGEHSLIPKK